MYPHRRLPGFGSSESQMTSTSRPLDIGVSPMTVRCMVTDAPTFADAGSKVTLAFRRCSRGSPVHLSSPAPPGAAISERQYDESHQERQAEGGCEDRVESVS